MTIAIETQTVCVVGAGYVGFPLANILSKNYQVISFDIDLTKINALKSRNGNQNHTFTSEPGKIAGADFILICVSTPLSESKRPNMTYIKEAAATVGRHMKRGATVIVESSVYPGATEELLKPILESQSGYRCGEDFHLAYSPERINPGDSEHSIDKITKIVAANDEETLKKVVDLYRNVTPNIFVARDIRTAEAAKLVENTQRDLNIAFINELSMMFHKMGISTHDVLEAAGTKWNFQKLSPGMVGGYCIPVSPYFLVQKAEEYGFKPQMILTGRSVNDTVPQHIARIAFDSLNQTGRVIKGSKVLIMGCSYKENVGETRETPVRDIIKELRSYGIDIYGYDPLIKDGAKHFGIKFINTIEDAPKMDCIIVTIVHDIFRCIKPNMLLRILNPKSVIIDIKGLYDSPVMRNAEVIYKRL